MSRVTAVAIESGQREEILCRALRSCKLNVFVAQNLAFSHHFEPQLPLSDVLNIYISQNIIFKLIFIFANISRP